MPRKGRGTLWYDEIPTAVVDITLEAGEVVVYADATAVLAKLTPGSQVVRLTGPDGIDVMLGRVELDTVPFDGGGRAEVRLRQPIRFAGARPGEEWGVAG